MPSAGFTITTFAQAQAALNANSTYSNYYADSSGTANAVTVTTGTGIVFTFTAGQLLQIKIANTNTGATTLSVNGTGANVVLPIGAAHLAGGELQVGGIYTVLYDGTNWQLIGAVAYPPTSAEVATAVSILFPSYPPGDIRRYGASTTQTAANNVTYIQAALNANAGYGPVIVPGGTYTLNSRITAPANTTIVLQNGATLYWSALTATGSDFPPAGSAGGPPAPTSPGIEVIGSNFSISGTGSVIGIAAGEYAPLEIGIYAQGASLASAYTGFYIGPGIELKNWRYAGVFIQFVNDVRVVGCRIHDCGYGGFQNLCGIRSIAHWNEVYNIQPGTSGNCYGIGHTYDSSNNSGAGRSDAVPPCFAVDVASNYVHDIPLWSGIDFHGGFDSRVHHNAVYNACNGMTAGAAPDSTGSFFGGESMILDHNVAYINQLNGTATTVDITGTAAPIGMDANGGEQGQSKSYIVSHNILYGYGNTGPGDDGSGSPTGFSIESDFMNGIVVDGNALRAWNGFGIRLIETDGLVRGNHFDAMARSMTGSSCVYMETATPPVTVDVLENKHRLPSGLAAAYGSYAENSAAPPYLLAANDLDSATTPAGPTSSTLPTGQLRGQSDMSPSITFATSGVVNVSGVGTGPVARISLTNAAAISITGISGAEVGEKIILHATTTSAVTINDGSAFRLHGGTWTSSQFDTLTLLCIASSGVQFIELMRSHNT